MEHSAPASERQGHAEGMADAAAWVARLAERPSEIKLHAGEMSVQEMRTVRAVLRLVAHKLNGN